MEDYEKKYKELLQEFVVAQDEITGLNEDIENLKSQFIFNEGTCRHLLTKAKEEVKLYKGILYATLDCCNVIEEAGIELKRSRLSLDRLYQEWENNWEGEEESQENNTI